jgi:hypothetical protein
MKRLKYCGTPDEGRFIERALQLPSVRSYAIAIGMLADAPADIRAHVKAYLSNGHETLKKTARRAPKLTPAQERKRKKHLKAHFAKLRAKRDAEERANG